MNYVEAGRPDPLYLVQVVDVQILGPDTPAVNVLQSADDLLQRQRLLLTAHKGRLRQLEDRVQVLGMNSVSKGVKISHNTIRNNKCFLPLD